MRLTSNKGFSFVEIVVVISILAILWVVASTTSTSFTNKTNNSKVTADIATIENSLVQYVTENKTLPMPKGNNKFYNEDTSYSHGIEDTPFAVSGFITESTLPKKYMNYTPMDPSTNQYYAYARTLIDSDVMRFELAWVNINDGEYESVVKGTYTGENWPYSLVKEYNWNDFVFDKSKNHFAYNPEEKVLVWKIDDFTGTARIDSIELWVITDYDAILEHVLVPWDVIVVETNSTANIVFSDGSQVMLWSTEENTELAIADMEFKEENNLFTDIKLVLNIGSAFTQAAKLDSKSNFEVYTSDTVAAVRGTVFWVNKSATNWTNVVVQQWAVKVEKNISNSTDLLNDVTKDNIDKTEVNVPWVTDANSTIIVNTWSWALWIVADSSGNVDSWTELLNNISDEIKTNIVDNIWVINNSDQVIVNELQKDGSEIKIEFELNKKTKEPWIFLMVDNWTKKYYLENSSNWILWTKDWIWLNNLNIENNTQLFSLAANPLYSRNNCWLINISADSDSSCETISKYRRESKTFEYIINWKDKIKVSFCRKRINEWYKCTKEKEINLNLPFNKSDIINSQVSKSEQLDLLVEKNKSIDMDNVRQTTITNYLPWLKTNYFNNNSLDYSSVSWNWLYSDISTKIDFNWWFFYNLKTFEWKTLNSDYVAIHYQWFFMATNTSHNFRLWWDDGIDFTFNWNNYWDYQYWSSQVANWIHEAWPNTSSNWTHITINDLEIWKYYPIDIKYYERTWYASFKFYVDWEISEWNFFHSWDKCLTVLDDSSWSSNFGLKNCADSNSMKFIKQDEWYSNIYSLYGTSNCLDVQSWVWIDRKIINFGECDNRPNQQFKFENWKLLVSDGEDWVHCLSMEWDVLKTKSCSGSISKWDFDGTYIKLVE